MARLLAVTAAFVLAACTESHVSIGEPCTSDRECSRYELVCDTGTMSCVECRADTDCFAEGELCRGGTCEVVTSCTTSRHCPGRVCDLDRGYCVDCVGAVDCSAAQRCDDGVCRASTGCSSDADCADGQRCEEGACRAGEGCSSDADCDPPTPACDMATRTCIECVGDEDCGSGWRCAPDRRCVPACAVDSDCDDGSFCTGRELCRPDAPGADVEGCLAGMPPCSALEICDEDAQECRMPDCGVDPDADGDGHASLACGGDDCDDSRVEAHPEAAEACNGRDDDCDALVDEDLGAVSCGLGACARTAPACVDGTAGTCTPGPPAVEVCDTAADEDCDGFIDEDCGCTGGEVVMTARYWCIEAQRYPQPPESTCAGDFSDCCVGGRITDPYYSGLPCPADVGVAHDTGWPGPCDGCIDDVIITNGGRSRSAAWRSDGTYRYCCDGNDVRRIRR